jgi:hypothetical protein
METVINLETYLRIKLDEKDAKQIYDISTDDVRGWIDFYNEAEIKTFQSPRSPIKDQTK